MRQNVDPLFIVYRVISLVVMDIHWIIMCQPTFLRLFLLFLSRGNWSRPKLWSLKCCHDATFEKLACFKVQAKRGFTIQGQPCCHIRHFFLLPLLLLQAAKNSYVWRIVCVVLDRNIWWGVHNKARGCCSTACLFILIKKTEAPRPDHKKSL